MDLGDERVSLQETPFATFMERAALAERAGQPDAVHVYFFADPVPGAYYLLPSNPFVAHNYAVLSNSYRKGGAMGEEEFVNYHVDIAYKYTHGIGYELFYVQKTRFTQDYCQKKGLLDKAR